MFELKNLTNRQVAEFFLNDPALAYLGLSDEALVSILETNELNAGKFTDLKGVYLDDELILVFKYETWSQLILNTHYYLKTEMHNTGRFDEIVDFLHAWVNKTFPHITKVITMCPSTCIHVPPIVKKYGFTLEGCVKDAMIWRQEVVDLLIFGKPLYTKENN